MAETPSPHIIIAHHDRYGVVAAMSHDNHVADHVLRLVGFERLSDGHLYALTERDRDLTRRGQQAVQSLRAARYRVTSDAAYDLEPTTGLNPVNTAPAFDAFSYTRGNGRPDPTPVTWQRRAQAATAISPVRADASVPRGPDVSVAHHRAPTPQQLIRVR